GQGGHRHPGAHDPTHVGCPHEPVAGMDVGEERPLLGDLHGESAVDVHRAFGPAGGARGVGDHHRVLGVDREGVCRLGTQHVGPGDVPSFGPGRVVAPGVAHHDNVVDAAAGDVHGGV